MPPTALVRLRRLPVPALGPQGAARRGFRGDAGLTLVVDPAWCSTVPAPAPPVPCPHDVRPPAPGTTVPQPRGDLR